MVLGQNIPQFLGVRAWFRAKFIKSGDESRQYKWGCQSNYGTPRSYIRKEDGREAGRWA